MKKIAFSLFLWVVATVIFAQKINISFNFTNVESGYDHKTRSVLYLDGLEMATSPATMETKGGKFTVSLSKGKHTIKVVNFAHYEGKWEAHTVENGYSVDCQFESVVDFKSKKSKLNLDLVFDLNAGTTFELSGKNYAVVE